MSGTSFFYENSDTPDNVKGVIYVRLLMRR